MVSTTAVAAGVATVHAGDRTLTVSFQGGNVRVDVSGVNRGYLLMRGDTVYSVMLINGQPLVLDARSAAGLLGGGLQTSPDMIRSLTHLSATGAHEAVAGRKGDVYTVTYVDEQGRSRTGRGVLAPEPEVRELTQSLAHMVLLLLQAAGQQPTQGTEQVLAALDQRGMGLLAYETKYRVESLSAAAPAAGTLDLPATPGQLPGNLGQLLQGLSPQLR